MFFGGAPSVPRMARPPMVRSSVPVLPSWVPAAGEAATFTSGGGVLTNKWADIFDPTAIGYDAAQCVDVTEYSAMFAHPTWRTHGGKIIWGGGHSATNYNGVTMVTFAASSIYFEAVLRPTAWTGGLLHTGNNSAQCNTTYGEATTDAALLRLAGPHSYGCGDVIDGVFLQPYGQALGYSNWGSAQAAHGLDLTDPSTAATARQWVRRTSSVGDWSPSGSPVITRYVPAQARQFMMTRGGGAPYSLQWFDPVANDWVQGSGTGFDYGLSDAPNFDPSSGALVYVPARDLLLGCWRRSGNLEIQYMNVAAGVSQPTLGGTATLSASLALPEAWGAIGWCPDNDRLHVFGVTGNTDKVYEIEIPATLANSWTVTAYTLPNSATIVPYVRSGTQSQGAWGKTFDYNGLTKCFSHCPNGLVGSGNDSIQVYRPRNT